LFILRDDGNDQFFVTFEKRNGQFLHIARGSGVSRKEFPDYVECIWEAYNLHGWKKYYLKLKSFLTLIYVKYYFYVVQIVSYLLCNFLNFLEILSECLEKAEKHNIFVGSLIIIVFYVPWLLMLVGTVYTLFFFWYYATMFPFFILAFSLKYFLLWLNWYYVVFVSQGLAAIYVCCFPEIKRCMPFSFGEIGDIKPESKEILLKLLQNFEIKPKQIMSVVPLLVQKRKKCWTECLDTIALCFLIFLAGLPTLLLLGAVDYFGEQI